MHPLINPVDLRKLITQFISVPIIGKISSYIREKIILGLFSLGESSLTDSLFLFNIVDIERKFKNMMLQKTRISAKENKYHFCYHSNRNWHIVKTVANGNNNFRYLREFNLKFLAPKIDGNFKEKKIEIYKIFKNLLLKLVNEHFCRFCLGKIRQRGEMNILRCTKTGCRKEFIFIKKRPFLIQKKWLKNNFIFIFKQF
ncbi:hypothetical protein NCER_102030 [Vairimorpha ceranae BRL01]|uniref:Uncharacterized protein n=2 Tax=Vairimorpha ceranae TaxID=40302 RepID=C4VB91_VAIC1|nr:hypothetical protein NCER_102030 [Vairimorpha ceranae BRL01]